MKKKSERKMSYRELARATGRSPSHIFRVLRGERQSKALTAALKKAGVVKS